MNRNDNQPTSDFELSAASLPWQDAVRSLFRHRKIILTTVAIGVSFAAVRAWTLPPTYKARSVLMVTDSRAHDVVTPEAATRTVVHQAGATQIRALAILLRDATVVREALERMRTNKGKGKKPSAAKRSDKEPTAAPARNLNPLAIPGSVYRKVHDVPVPSELDHRATSLARLVRVAPIHKTALIELSFISPNPTWAAAFINGLSETLIDRYRRIYENSSTQEFFRNQSLVLSAKQTKAEAARAEFRDRIGAELLTLNRDALQSRIAALNKQLDEAKTNRTVLLSKAEAVINLDANPALAAVKHRIIQLQLERSTLLSRYTKTSVAVRDLDRQITEAQRLLAYENEATLAIQRGTVESAIGSIDVRVAAVREQVSVSRANLRELEKVAPEWERLENDVSSAKAAYLTYSRKEEQARLSNALDESNIVNVAIVERAVPPTQPESSPIKQLMVTGFAGSLLLGMGIALMRDWLDPSVKTTLQVERITGLPVLGEIQV